MNKMRLVTQQETVSNQLQTYQGVKKNLEKRLTAANNEFEFTKLISDVNTILKTQDLNQKNKIDLKNFRQKIYDRKKKSQEINLTQLSRDNVENNHTETPSRNDQDASRFDQDLPKNRQDFFLLHKNFKTLDFFFIFKKVFAILLFGICACLTALFVWKQSIPLYEVVGFLDPKFCALGTILMIVGFSTIYSMTKSKIALILCLYVSTYEIILIVNGTFRHDTVQIQNGVENNSELQWLREQTTHSGELYQTAKAQFDNPNSKVFQNSWYKEKYMMPAWEKYSSDQNKLMQKRGELKSETKNAKNDSILKILFRLGIVFLCMVSVHNLLKIVSISIMFKTSKHHEIFS